MVCIQNNIYHQQCLGFLVSCLDRIFQLTDQIYFSTFLKAFILAFYQSENLKGSCGQHITRYTDYTLRDTVTRNI